MKSELLSLSRLFTETIYRIPDYQRGYAWTEKHVRDFWNDVEQLEPGRNHYTGVLTVEEVPRDTYERWDDDLWIIDSKRYRPLYVVDGQQRLTTAMVLVQCILERLGDTETLNYTARDEIRKKFIFESRDAGISRSYLFGYEKDNPSYEFLKRDIFVERSDTHAVSEETIYTKNLRAAKSFFKEKISAVSFSELEQIYVTLTQSLLFNIYVISDDIDVFVTFETMNNRGKPLSVLELLKNRLIYLSTKLPAAQDERAKLRSTINECWKSAYHYLGLSEDLIIGDDEFLQRHYALYFGSREFAALTASAQTNLFEEEEEEEEVPTLAVLTADYKQFLLEKHFIVRNVRGSTPLLDLNALYEYAHSIKAYVEVNYQIANPFQSRYSKEEKRVLAQIERIGVGNGSGSAGFQLLLLALYTAAEPVSPAVRTRILKHIENILFVGTLGWWRIEDYKMLDASLLAVRLAAGDLEVSDLLSALQDHINERNEAFDAVRVLGWWARKPLGYYRWRSVAYFMFEYEQKLREASKSNREKLEWKQFVAENEGGDYKSIEHILPQKLSHDYWKQRVQGYSIAERNSLKHSIGNLVPLSKAKNSSLSNKPFPEKKGSAASSVGFAYGCYSENEIAQETDWSPRQIVERGVRLLTFMEERWGVPIGSREKKISVLGLDFVK